MLLFSMTEDEIEKLQNQIYKKKDEIEKYENTTIKELWKNELNELLVEYNKFLKNKNNSDKKRQRK